MRSMHRVRPGPWGSTSSGGTLSPALRRLGGTWRAEEDLQQSKGGSLRRVTKGVRRRRAFAEPNVRDDWSARE